MNKLHLFGSNDMSLIPQKSGYKELEKIVMYPAFRWASQPAGWQGCTILRYTQPAGWQARLPAGRDV